MDNIIAGTYKIEQKIGAGGGGTVYLGRHLRLGKQVVLKADKRTLNAKPDVLRREVDALKNLSHTYIPQVYDFVSEGDSVYTVMDFIPGESLDKPLNRGERFEQAQVIRWACQLLEALQYLHSRPPHGILHGDIKPANIMLTPEGDIRLIDFNIALALGEEGAVQVGFSRGYASPEHYGIDYRSKAKQEPESAETQMDDSARTVLPGESTKSMNGDGRVRLDVRSDIYSLGATLYHLLSGVKPEQDAKAVMELDRSQASQAVARVIQKAMSPNPDERYQTAGEMLEAFQTLWENDPRTRRFRRTRNIVAGSLAAVFLAGAAMTFAGLRQMERAQAVAAQEARQAEEQERQGKEALTAVRASENAYQQGDIPAAIQKALEALSTQTPYSTQAQKALTDALGVYDLTDGFKAHALVTLPDRAMKQTLSADGRYAAVLSSGQVNVVELASGQISAQLPANSSAFSDMIFTGNNVLIYAGAEGLSAYDPAAQTQLWCVDAEKGETIALSGDGSKIAVTDGGSDPARFYSAVTGEKEAVRESSDWPSAAIRSPINDAFADPMDDLFVLDDSGSHLAVSFEDGGIFLLNKEEPENSIIVFDKSDYTCFNGGFWGEIFGVCVGNGASAEFLAVDVQAGELISSLSSNEDMHLTVCADGFCLAQSNVLVHFDPRTGAQTELAYTQEGIRSFSHVPGRTLVQTQTGRILFFDENAALFDQCDISNDFADIAGEYAVLSGRDAQTLQILRLENYPDALLATYPGDYFHDEARVTSDGNLLLFSAEGARLYEPGGELRGENDFSSIQGEIFDLQYRREDDKEYLEVLYDSADTGISLRLSAQDLSVLSEEKIPLSDKTLYEEFPVGDYVVTSPLHATPRVINAATGETVKELEADGYLTYVTAVSDGVITEYVTTDGTRYGLLLNKDWEVIADLPGLCDILPDGTLIFDDGRGTLRQNKIYTLDELRELARQ